MTRVPKMAQAADVGRSLDLTRHTVKFHVGIVGPIFSDGEYPLHVRNNSCRIFEYTLYPSRTRRLKHDDFDSVRLGVFTI